MRAVRFHGIGKLTVEDIAPPAAPGEGAVHLRVLAAGICGSDLHNFKTGQWIAQLPVTPGHEFTAEVISVGAGVSDFAPGDRVIADSRASCGACVQCQAGRPNLCLKLGYVGEVCDGGFAEEVVLPARGLLKVDAAVPPQVAALSEPLAVALHAIKRAAPEPGKPVLVAGAGPVGGLACLLLKHLGFGPVLFAERNQARRALVEAVTGAVPVELDAVWIGQPFDCAIEATGVPAVLGKLIALAGPAARIALVGIPSAAASINAIAVVERELELKGCSAFRDELPEAVALLQALEAPLSLLVEDPIDLQSVPEAYQRLISGGSDRLKTIIRP
ncbi:zinc-binding dehydrogenase [Dongia sp.]|uniref:zinc-dependent alcohol dehydrogenase n=1 Tax=Dongia sp. TaxID=1977262 RepID=UPI0037502A09